MTREGFILPDGLVTEDAALATELWAEVFYKAKDALERIYPVPKRLLSKTPVRNLEEILTECESVLKIGDKLGS